MVELMNSYEHGFTKLQLVTHNFPRDIKANELTCFIVDSGNWRDGTTEIGSYEIEIAVHKESPILEKFKAFSSALSTCFTDGEIIEDQKASTVIMGVRQTIVPKQRDPIIRHKIVIHYKVGSKESQ